MWSIITTLSVYYSFCGGLYLDIKRKLPWLPSDFYEGFHIQSISAVLFIYLGCITNAITFGGLLGDATDNYQVKQSAKVRQRNKLIYVTLVWSLDIDFKERGFSRRTFYGRIWLLALQSFIIIIHHYHQSEIHLLCICTFYLLSCPQTKWIINLMCAFVLCCWRKCDGNNSKK